MSTNKELKIAAIVGGIMIIVCLLLVAIFQNKNEVNIEVHKHVAVEEDGHGYWDNCDVPSSILQEINTEYKKAIAIKDLTKEVSGTIEGNYRIILDDQMIVFDNKTDKVFYNSKTNKLYTFDSTMYELVINSCE